jgi:endo-1,4-beta-mannosidase
MSQDLGAVAVIIAAIGFFFVTIKNWLSKREVNKISEEDRKLFRNQEEVAAKLQTEEHEFGYIPEEEAAKEDKQAIDEWNGK